MAVIATAQDAHEATVAGVRAAVEAAGLRLSAVCPIRARQYLTNAQGRELGVVQPTGEGEYEARRGANAYRCATREEAAAAALRGVLGW